jgi:lactate racemase
MNIELAYGKTGLDVVIPDENLAGVLRMTETPVLPDPVRTTREKIAAPTGTPSLAELAKGKKSACVVVSDITRPVPNSVIVPPIMETLEAAGIPRENITILIATGIHRPNEGDELITILGEDLPKKYRVVNHMPRDVDSHEYLGETPIYKAPIWVDKTFLAADLRIATGLIEPHLMAGYSGGRKAVVPGCSAFETLKVLHGAPCMAHENNTEGVIEGNTFHSEALHIARLARTDFIVNVTLNETRGITGVFAGDLDEAHMEGIRFMSTQCRGTVPEKVDAVITSSAGFPLDLTFYQIVKGMTAVQNIVKKGGVIIIVARIAEGIGSPEFTDLIIETSSPGEFENNIGKPDYNLVLDQWQLQKLCQVLRNNEVWLYTEGLDKDTQEQLFVKPLDSVEQGIELLKERFGANARIAVVPDGPYVMAQCVGE